jgi:threonine/homoserine/homoserine lactone efflux protein
MDLLGFALAVLLIELTPGPNMGWLVMLTLAEGRRAGLAAISGIALGLSANAVISALATSFILQQSEVIAQTISVLGAAMMSFLAWQAWQDAGEASQATTPKHSDHRNFVTGFLINLLNPKATLFFVTVMPQFVADGRPSYAQALILAAISVVIATTIHLALVLGAEQLRPVLMGGTRARLVSRVLALGMLGVAAWFLAKAFL